MLKTGKFFTWDSGFPLIFNDFRLRKLIYCFCSHFISFEYFLSEIFAFSKSDFSPSENNGSEDIPGP